MTEDFLHYIWKFRLYDGLALYSDEGQKVEIVHPGFHNKDSGPDFSHAKVRIGDQLWVGNIEIHTFHSDWDKHGHGDDPSYDNIILHVVYEKDVEHLRNVKGHFPTLELKGYFDEHRFWRFQQLLSSGVEFPCQSLIGNVDKGILMPWLERNLVDRLEQKSDAVIESLKQCDGNWNELMYRFIARSLGLHINADPMWWLAHCTPLRLAGKYIHDREVLEALLLGQSGLLFERKVQTDDQIERWRNEYAHLCRKHTLEPLQPEVWKFLRLRPPSFPTLRIAQLAALISRYPNIFDVFYQSETHSAANSLFEVDISDYWLDHYVLGKVSTTASKSIGRSKADVILVNGVVPVLFAYGRQTGNEALQHRMLNWLEGMPPERNRITNAFADAGVRRCNAGVSQAKLQLFHDYCEPKRCLQCAVGVKLVGEN